MDQGEELLVFHLDLRHFLAGAVKFFILVVLRIERMDDIDACQIFPGDPVDFIRQLLHQPEPGDANAHDCQHRRADDDDERRSHRGELPALAQNFDDSPDRHDR